MSAEQNTNNNLLAQIELFAEEGDAYKFLFIAKGCVSASKSYLFQETKGNDFFTATKNKRQALTVVGD